MRTSIITKTIIAFGAAILIFVALALSVSTDQKLSAKRNEPSHLATTKAVRNMQTGNSKSSLRNIGENPNHKTAEAWLADPLFKSLRPEIRIDYFCRQLILASCSSEALKLIEAEKDTVKRGYLIAAVSDEWSKTDPIDCYTWAIGLKDQNEKERALGRCMNNAARTGNADLVFQLYDEIPSGSTKDSVLNSSIVELIKLDRCRVIERLANISNIDQIRFASKMLAGSFLGTNNLAAVREHWETLP